MIHSFLPPLHGSGVTGSGWLYSQWSIDPGVVASAIAASVLYLWAIGAFRNRSQTVGTGRQHLYFFAGIVSFLLVLGPPFHDWADDYLLSAHMFQHMALLFVAAPLLLAGIPGQLYQPLVDFSFTNKIIHFLTRPAIALVVSNAVITIWHFPGAYDLALKSDQIHAAQHMSFLFAAMLGWWPVLGTQPAWPSLQPIAQCLYLFLYSIPNGIVGAFVTLSEPGFYHYYTTAPRIWGIDLATDQQLAGVMMWVGGGLIYLLWITVIFFRWAGEQEKADRQPPPATTDRDRTSQVVA